ncbi:hypothetical protein SAY86_012563 [Trapa natans]|uniref:Uncharacterized protein n=1 Tax=Trapa natans TaxID=22666 RepID=A0AAN7R7A3_TRANT|nr:hypothetical protein SAY86_012563 [Trapa natans]
MKKLIRRLSRVADSTAKHCFLRPDESSARRRRAGYFRALSKHRCHTGGVPAGHVPIYVGEEMERFLVYAELLNHPVLAGLLDKSAQEYGYEQKGALRIPCHVAVFERILEALRLGEESIDLQDFIISALTTDGSLSEMAHILSLP